MRRTCLKIEPALAKQRGNSAVLDFVKLDVEPKINALETDKKKLKQQVSSLRTENRNLKQRISALERELSDRKYIEKQNIDKLTKHNEELEGDNRRLQTLVDSLSSMTDNNKKQEQVQEYKDRRTGST